MKVRNQRSFVENQALRLRRSSGFTIKACWRKSSSLGATTVDRDIAGVQRNSITAAIRGSSRFHIGADFNPVIELVLSVQCLLNG